METISPEPQDLESAVRLILSKHDDPTREGLRDTPKRYTKFLEEFLSPPKFNMTTFDAEGYDQMIVINNIPFYSLCEHHLAPFTGVGHIAYIPNDRLVGLSKIPRTLEMFARRFQNQERITQQVAEYLEDHLKPKGVAVVLTAKHLCVEMRGVQKHGVMTSTSKMTGVFLEDLNARTEFLKLIGQTA